MFPSLFNLAALVLLTSTTVLGAATPVTPRTWGTTSPPQTSQAACTCSSSSLCPPTVQTDTADVLLTSFSYTQTAAAPSPTPSFPSRSSRPTLSPSPRPDSASTPTRSASTTSTPAPSRPGRPRSSAREPSRTARPRGRSPESCRTRRRRSSPGRQRLCETVRPFPPVHFSFSAKRRERGGMDRKAREVGRRHVGAGTRRARHTVPPPRARA